MFAKPDLILRKFSEQYFTAYRSWFEYKSIHKYLGHIDHEWLHHILNDQAGAEYAVIDPQNELQCVIGIVFPNIEHNYYVLTNIAVNPLTHQKGIGSMALKLVLNKLHLQKNQFWLTYVDFNNSAAQQFFKKNNWVEQKVNKPLANNLLSYKWPA